MYSREVVNDARIEVQPDICVTVPLVALGVVGILLDWQSGSTSAVYGIGIDTIRPREVEHGVEPVPITLSISSLQGVVARVAVVGQLDSILVQRITAAILEYRIKRARTIPSG